MSPREWDERPPEGPFIKPANGLPGFEVALLQTYQGQNREPVEWRGKVRLRFMGEDLMDIEGSLLRSKRDDSLYFAMPERSYRAQNGDTKYVKVVFVHDRNLAGTIADAIRTHLGLGPQRDDGPPLDDSELPL